MTKTNISPNQQTLGYDSKGTTIFPMIYKFLEDSTKSVLGACHEMHQNKVTSTNIPLQNSTVFWLFFLLGVGGGWVLASKSDQHVLSN